MKKTAIKAMCAAMAAAMSVAAFASCGKNPAENKFFIGATGPLTGDTSSYGISVKQGAELAVKEINAAGGLNGYEFYFDMKDDEADATKAANGYTALYEAGMQVSLGSVTSGACEAFANEAKKDNMFFMTPSASSAKAIQDDNAYRICFGDPDQGIISADTLAESYTKIGVIYDSSDTYSSGIYASFKEQVKTKEGIAVTEKSFTSETAVDFSQQVSDLKNAGCEVVYLPIYYTQANLIIREAVKQSYQPDFFGCDGLDGLKALLEVDNKIADIEGEVSYMTPFDAEAQDEKTKNFVAAYKEAYKVTPDQFAADGYDAVYVLYEAMKKADVKDVKISASDLCEILKTTISADDFTFTGVTGGMTWDASGAPAKEPVIVKLS